MSIRVTLIPGDGIGPEVVNAAVEVIEAAGCKLEWERAAAGASAMPTHGTPIPAETLESIRRNKLALKGPLATPIGEGYRSANVALRKEFDLYANVRPARSFADVEFKEMIVDNCAMQLVKNPNQFDVLVTTNLFGDILSDLTSGLIGGLGLTAGANIGKDAAIFEAVHGTAPDIAGKGVSNPTAGMPAGLMPREHNRARTPAAPVG